MPNIADISVLDAELFLLIMARVSLMVMLLPVIGGRQVIGRVKIGLAIFLTIIVFTGIPKTEIILPTNAPEFFWLAIKELFVGILMGFSASLLFIGLNIAGRIIDHNTGFSMIQTINPMTDANESVVGQIQFIVFSLILFVTGGHQFFIEIIFETYNAIPISSVDPNMGGINLVLIKITSQCFQYGIKLAAPILVPLMLTTTGLAIVARIMPQVNVWLVGMPLKIGIGLMTVGFVMPLVWLVFNKGLSDLQMYQLLLLKLLAGSA